MKTVDVLKKAKELISDSARWCKYTYARDAEDVMTGPHGASACQWVFDDWDKAEGILNLAAIIAMVQSLKKEKEGE